MAAMAVIGMAGCENASTTNSSPVESVTAVSEKKSEVIAAVNSEPSEPLHIVRTAQKSPYGKFDPPPVK